MKRDSRLLSEILSTIESQEDEAFVGEFDFKDTYTVKQINYHTNLLKEAGFIKIESFDAEGGNKSKETSLTWQGHEYLNRLQTDLVKKAINRM